MYGTQNNVLFSIVPYFKKLPLLHMGWERERTHLKAAWSQWNLNLNYHLTWESSASHLTVSPLRSVIKFLPVGYVGKSCKRGKSIMWTFKGAIKPRKTRVPKVLREKSRIMSKRRFYYLSLEITKGCRLCLGRKGLWESAFVVTEFVLRARKY